RTCIAVCAMLVSAAVLAEPSRTLDRIKSESTIHLGFRGGAAPFSFKDPGGVVRGYSVELCTKIAAAIEKQLGPAELESGWTALDAANRIDAVASGKVDIECGTTTISLSRMERVDFSLPIFADGGSVLTRVDSKLARLADFNGRRLAVIPGTTTESALKREL